jgi:hypothetical protein
MAQVIEHLRNQRTNKTNGKNWQILGRK